MIFFADENFSVRLAKLLEAFDPTHSVRILQDQFPKGTPDTDWIPEVAKWTPKPALLCGDGRILRNKAEKAALKSAAMTFVLFAPGWTETPWNDLAWKTLKVWPMIIQDVEHAQRPTIFNVTVNMKVERRGLLADL